MSSRCGGGSSGKQKQSASGREKIRASARGVETLALLSPSSFISVSPSLVSVLSVWLFSPWPFSYTMQNRLFSSCHLSVSLAFLPVHRLTRAHKKVPTESKYFTESKHCTLEPLFTKPDDPDFFAVPPQNTTAAFLFQHDDRMVAALQSVLSTPAVSPILQAQIGTVIDIVEQDSPTSCNICRQVAPC